MSYIVLHFATTGLDAYYDEVLQIGVVDSAGTVLMNQYVTPEGITTVPTWDWREAEALHGISPEFIRAGNYPTKDQVLPELYELCRGKQVITYSVSFAWGFLGDALEESTVESVMDGFAQHYGEFNEYHGTFTYQPLSEAADYVGHDWGQGKRYDAVADALAVRSIHLFLGDPELQAKAVRLREQRYRERRENEEVQQYLAKLEKREQQEFNTLCVVKGQELLNRLGLPFTVWDEYESYDRRGNRAAPAYRKAARESAEVFCMVVTGWKLDWWVEYGELLLGKIYEPGEAFPAKYSSPVRYWKWIKEPAPVGLRIPVPKPGTYQKPFVELYDWSQLELGVDWVPVVDGYPANCYSETRLRREFKLKPTQIKAMRPCAFKSTKYVDYYLFHYIPESVTKEAVVHEA